MDRFLAIALQIPGIKSFFSVSVLRVVKPSDKKTNFSNGDVFWHAIKTPISTAQCCLDDIKSLDVVPKKMMEDLELSLGQIRSLAQSGEQSAEERGRGEVEEPGAFGVLSAIKKTMTLFDRRFPSFHILELIQVSPDVMIAGQEHYFMEALLCVLINAAESYKKEDKAKVIILMAVFEEDMLALDVMDLGIGMSKAAIKLAKFKGVSYKQGGKGLGLPFVQHTIERVFNGKLQITSKSKQGTRVSWRLPANTL